MQEIVEKIGLPYLQRMRPDSGATGGFCFFDRKVVVRKGAKCILIKIRREF